MISERSETSEKICWGALHCTVKWGKKKKAKTKQPIVTFQPQTSSPAAHRSDDDRIHESLMALKGESLSRLLRGRGVAGGMKMLQSPDPLALYDSIGFPLPIVTVTRKSSGKSTTMLDLRGLGLRLVRVFGLWTRLLTSSTSQMEVC